MALNCETGLEKVRICIDPEIQVELVPKFLMDHMELNIKQIAAQLNRNEDEAQVKKSTKRVCVFSLHLFKFQVLIHAVIRRMFENAGALQSRGNLGSKKNREIWEKEFGAMILSPEVDGLAGTLTDLARIVKNDQNSADDALLMILSEKMPQDEDDQIQDSVAQLQFWIPRQKINLESVPHKVGKQRMKNKLPILSKLLEYRETLELTNVLPEILKLHMKLMSVSEPAALDSTFIAITY